MPVPEIVKLNAATYLQGADPAKPTAAPIGDLVSLIQARSVQVDEGRFGIWISSPGRWHRQITSAEFCFFLEGECTFTPDGGEPIEIRAGDVAPREFKRADGRTLIYSVTALSGGKRLVSYFDITEMKDREAALAEALEKAKLAEAVIDSVPNPIFVKDRNLDFVLANNAFASIFGNSSASGFRSRACAHWYFASSVRPTRQ